MMQIIDMIKQSYNRAVSANDNGDVLQGDRYVKSSRGC